MPDGCAPSITAVCLSPRNLQTSWELFVVIVPSDITIVLYVGGSCYTDSVETREPSRAPIVHGSHWQSSLSLTRQKPSTVSTRLSARSLLVERSSVIQSHRRWLELASREGRCRTPRQRQGPKSRRETRGERDIGMSKQTSKHATGMSKQCDGGRGF